MTHDPVKSMLVLCLNRLITERDRRGDEGYHGSYYNLDEFVTEIAFGGVPGIVAFKEGPDGVSFVPLEPGDDADSVNITMFALE